MVWFYVRGDERRSCETRLLHQGDGFELVICEAGEQHVERFAHFRDLLAREHSLLAAWKAQGWANVQSGTRVPQTPTLK